MMELMTVMIKNGKTLIKDGENLKRWKMELMC